MSKHTELIKKIIAERHDLSELSSDTLRSYSKKAGDRINAIKAKGWKKTSAEAGEMLHLDKNKAKAVSKINSKTPAAKTEPTKPVHDKDALHSKLKQLKRDFDPSYQHSDDHSVYTKHRDIHAKITDIEKKLRESEDLDELSKETLGSYIGKADKEVHDLGKKSARSKNLQRAYDLLGQAQKRRKGSNTAVAKLSRKLAGERWGIKEESEELDEAGVVVHSSKEKDGKEYQVLSRKNNREFVIQSKKKDGTWHSHDAVGSAQRARQLITTGRYSSVNEDDADIKEGEIVSADKKVGADGRLYPRSRRKLGKSTGSLTGATT